MYTVLAHIEGVQSQNSYCLLYGARRGDLLSPEIDAE